MHRFQHKFKVNFTYFYMKFNIIKKKNVYIFVNSRILCILVFYVLHQHEQLTLKDKFKNNKKKSQQFCCMKKYVIRCYLTKRGNCDKFIYRPSLSFLFRAIPAILYTIPSKLLNAIYRLVPDTQLNIPRALCG